MHPRNLQIEAAEPRALRRRLCRRLPVVRADDEVLLRRLYRRLESVSAVLSLEVYALDVRPPRHRVVVWLVDLVACDAFRPVSVLRRRLQGRVEWMKRLLRLAVAHCMFDLGNEGFVRRKPFLD